MTRQKSFRKADFINSPIGFKEERSKRGKWSEWYGNEHPVVLELGCGKGEMAIGLAALDPGKNYMGIDRKSDRLWVASRDAMEAGLKNIAFQRMDILEISEFFGENEVDEIWITFPDPYPKKKQSKRRLTHFRYLSEYKKILKPDGIIRFKTDNKDLFEWTLEHLNRLEIKVNQKTFDLHHSELIPEVRKILTSYEKKFLDMGMKINYMDFSLKGMLEELPPEEEED